MRCAAPISQRALVLRSRHSTLDARCLREGKLRAGGKWFCRQHYPTWKTHYEIVERIRAFPER